MNEINVIRPQTGQNMIIVNKFYKKHPYFKPVTYFWY